MLSDHCPVCLSVTLVYCGQTVRWIKTKLVTEVGLCPGHNVSALDGDPALPLRCRPDVAKFSFRNRVVNEWNILNKEIISGCSLAGFKRKLDRHLRDKRGYI